MEAADWIPYVISAGALAVSAASYRVARSVNPAVRWVPRLERQRHGVMVVVTNEGTKTARQAVLSIDGVPADNPRDVNRAASLKANHIRYLGQPAGEAQVTWRNWRGRQVWRGGI